MKYWPRDFKTAIGTTRPFCNVELRAVPVERRVDGRFHQAAGGALAQPSVFCFFSTPLAVCLHYLPNATKQLRSEMAPKRFRLFAYKPTTWQLAALPIALGLIPRSYWLLEAVCQTEGRHRPRHLLISVHDVLSLTFGLTGQAHSFGVSISALKGSPRRSSRQL